MCFAVYPVQAIHWRRANSGQPGEQPASRRPARRSMWRIGYYVNRQRGSYRPSFIIIDRLRARVPLNVHWSTRTAVSCCATLHTRSQYHIHSKICSTNQYCVLPAEQQPWTNISLSFSWSFSVSTRHSTIKCLSVFPPKLLESETRRKQVSLSSWFKRMPLP